MTFKEIQDLINLVAKTNMAEVKLKNGDFELIVRSADFSSGKNAPVAPVAPAQVAMAPAPIQMPAVPVVVEKAATQEDSKAEHYIEVKSPMVGTFYRSSGPDKPAFVQVGDTIHVGQKICIIEAMKLFNEIESEVSGKIIKMLLDDATPVEYDQALFLIDPAG